MPEFDSEQLGTAPTLSRRRVLQAGSAAMLASGSVGDAAASLGEGVQSGKRPSLSWNRDLGTELDTRVEAFDEHDIAVVLTDLLTAADNQVFAFDRTSGERLWTGQVQTVPWLQSHEGLLYHTNRGPLAAIDPRTGERQWAVRGDFERPVAFGESQAAFSGGVSRATVVDLAERSVAWQPSRPHLSDVLAVENRRVVLAGGTELAAFDAASGDPMWRFTDLPDDEFGPSIVPSWPYCFVTSVDPAVTEAFNLREGTRLWRREVERYPLYFETADRELVLTMDDGTVRRLNPTTGKAVWSQSLTDEQVFLYFVDGGLAVPVANDSLWGLSVEDGSVEWELQLDSAFPLVTREAGRLYAAGTSVQGIDSTGTIAWTEELPGSEPIYPAASGDHLVAASGTTVYGYELVEDAAGEHQSGVSQELYNAVSGDDADLSRPEVISLIDEYVTNQSFDGITVNRSDVINLINYYIGRST